MLWGCWFFGYIYRHQFRQTAYPEWQKILGFDLMHSFIRIFILFLHNFVKSSCEIGGTYIMNISKFLFKNNNTKIYHLTIRFLNMHASEFSRILYWAKWYKDQKPCFCFKEVISISGMNFYAWTLGEPVPKKIHFSLQRLMESSFSVRGWFQETERTRNVLQSIARTRYNKYSTMFYRSTHLNIDFK